jgi:hypothetical protein
VCASPHLSRHPLQRRLTLESPLLSANQPPPSSLRQPEANFDPRGKLTSACTNSCSNARYSSRRPQTSQTAAFTRSRFADYNRLVRSARRGASRVCCTRLCHNLPRMLINSGLTGLASRVAREESNAMSKDPVAQYAQNLTGSVFMHQRPTCQEAQKQMVLMLPSRPLHRLTAMPRLPHRLNSRDGQSRMRWICLPLQILRS